MMESPDGGGGPIQLLAQSGGAKDIINVLKMTGFQPEPASKLCADKCSIWAATAQRQISKRPRR